MSEQPVVPVEFERLTDEQALARSREFRDGMVTRRSVRNFDSRPVPREVIENALMAAGSAPSGANMQPWHFVVVSSPEMKRTIREHAEEVERTFYANRITNEWRGALEPLGLDTDKPFLEEASALIVIFRRNHTVDGQGTLHKTYYPMESTGIAAGMLIAALHLSGVAMVPYTPSPPGFLVDVLGRTDAERPFLVLAVGYPAPGATVPDLAKDPLERIATFIEVG